MQSTSASLGSFESDASLPPIFDFDAYLNGGLPQALDNYLEEGTEAVLLNSDAGVAVPWSVMPVDIATEGRPIQYQESLTGRNAPQVRGAEPINPIPATESFVVANFVNDTNTDDEVLNLVHNGVTQLPTGIYSNSALAVDQNPFWTDGNPFTLDPDLNPSAPSLVADSIAFGTIGMQQSSRTSSDDYSAMLQQDLPNDVYQYIAQEYLQEHPTIAKNLAIKCLEDKGYRQQASQSSGKVSSYIPQQQEPQYSDHLSRSGLGFLGDTYFSSPSCFPQNSGTYVDTTGAPPLGHNVNVTQMPSWQNFGNFQASQGDIATSHTSFDGASSDTWHGVYGANHEISFDTPSSSRITASSIADNANPGSTIIGLHHISHPEDSLAVPPFDPSVIFSPPKAVSTSPTLQYTNNWTTHFAGPINSNQSPPQSLPGGTYQKSLMANRLEVSSTNSQGSKALSSTLAVQQGTKRKAKNPFSPSGESKRKPNGALESETCLSCKMSKTKVSAMKPHLRHY